MHQDDLETFIVIHDQALLLACEREDRFSSLDRYRYVFVGAGPVDMIEDRPDVIVARRLRDNIEEHPSLLSFTAWYAVTRNGLATARSVALLEYDVTVLSAFERETVKALGEHGAIVGYIPLRLTHPMFLYVTPWLVDSMQRTYGLDVTNLVRTHLERGGADSWMTTTNRAMSVETLRSFVDWFAPVTVDFRHHPEGSAVHERAVSVFCLLNEIADRHVPGVLEHHQSMSHRYSGPTPEEVRQRAFEGKPLVPTHQQYRRLLDACQALDEQSARVVQLEAAIAANARRMAGLEAALAEQAARESVLERRAATSQRRYQDVIRSRSWRLTAPLRMISEAWRRHR